MWICAIQKQECTCILYNIIISLAVENNNFHLCFPMLSKETGIVIREEINL